MLLLHNLQAQLDLVDGSEAGCGARSIGAFSKRNVGKIPRSIEKMLKNAEKMTKDPKKIYVYRDIFLYIYVY